MRLLFIGGCERSGTTLLQRLVCAHRHITGGPEFVFTGRIAELYDRMRAEMPPEYARRLAAFYDRAKLAESFRRLLSGFFDELARREPEAVFLSEKTPSNIFAAATLLELFPDALFVHVVRDGRDVLASHRRVAARLRAGGRGDLRAHRTRAVCGRWNGAIDRHFGLVSDPELGERYHAVRFEELVTEPDKELAKLFDFLGLDLEPAVLTPEEPPAAGSPVVVDDLWVTGADVGRGFDPAAVGRWRRELGIGRRILAEVLAGHNLSRLGYPVGPLARAVSIRLRHLARRSAQQRAEPETGPGA